MYDLTNTLIGFLNPAKPKDLMKKELLLFSSAW